MSTAGKSGPMVNTRVAVAIMLAVVIAVQSACGSALSDQLMACLNTQSKFEIASWQGSLVEQKIDRLQVAHMWWPSDDAAIGLPITIVTHASSSRLEHLEAQCRVWQGPIVAVVYLPLTQLNGSALDDDNRKKVDDATGTIQTFYDRVAAAGPCQLSMMLVWQVFETEQAGNMLYPYNAIRNYAMLQARTDLMAMVDVDFVPSAAFQESLKRNSSRIAEMANSSNTIFIMPAFRALDCPSLGMSGTEAGLKAAAGTKAQLRELAEAGCTPQFGIRDPTAHRPSDYPTFFTSTAPYPVTWVRGYEPYFIINRLEAPPYDISFKGYGRDKQVYTALLAQQGYRMMVLPDAWVLHLPHTETAASRDYLRASQSILRMVMNRKGHSTYRAIAAGAYWPEEDAAPRTCRAVLPWWASARLSPALVTDVLSE